MRQLAYLLSTLLLVVTACTWSLSASAQSEGSVSVTDSRGVQHFEKIPQRVVVLNWPLAENLIELGITPAAMTDVAGYEKWVVRPALPDGIVDIGTRETPNMERIAELQPDVIILTNPQADMIEPLERIAPVLYFESFTTDRDNLKVAREVFLEMARLFDREQLAREKLARMDQRIEQLKSGLAAHFSGGMPQVACVRFNTPSLVWVFGANSMPQAALDRLGLPPALPQPASLWGVSQKKTAELGQISEGIVLYLQPFDQADTLFATPLWNAMPFVQAGRIAPVRSTWTYGGALSEQYLAEALTDALLTISPAAVSKNPS